MALPDFSMRQLLEAGVHFGHQTHRWNPKMAPYIFGARNNIHIIDLSQTVPLLDQALKQVSDTVAKGGRVLFVGTKRQAQDSVREAAEASRMPYVNQRWSPGLLTNFQTSSKRIKTLNDLERLEAEGQLELLPSQERIARRKELTKLQINLGGVKDLRRAPDAVFVIDVNSEKIAVEEARKLRIPVIALVDTNVDPDGVDYPVPGNDDAIRSVALLTKIIADGVAEGLMARSGGGAAEAGKAEGEPLAEWEKDLLEAEKTEDTTKVVEPAGETVVEEADKK